MKVEKIVVLFKVACFSLLYVIIEGIMNNMSEALILFNCFMTIFAWVIVFYIIHKFSIETKQQ